MRSTVGTSPLITNTQHLCMFLLRKEKPTAMEKNEGEKKESDN